MARVLLFGPLRDLAGWRERDGLEADTIGALKTLLVTYQRDGRSTPGAAQKNDVPVSPGREPGKQGPGGNKSER